MSGCKSCNITVRTERGEINVDMCKMLETCTCKHEKNVAKNTA